MANPTTTSTQSSDKQNKKMRILGITTDFWLGIFAVLAAIPYINLVALPLGFVAAAVILALYVFKHSKDEPKPRV